MLKFRNKAAEVFTLGLRLFKLFVGTETVVAQQRPDLGSVLVVGLPRCFARRGHLRFIQFADHHRNQDLLRQQRHLLHQQIVKLRGLLFGQVEFLGQS